MRVILFNMKTKTVKKPVNKPQYTANAIIMGKKYQGKGTTVAEAISSLKGFGNVKSKVILAVTDGKTTKERVIMPMVAWRIFGSHGVTKEIALKQISQLFF
jgi:hypothetical protein